MNYIIYIYIYIERERGTPPLSPLLRGAPHPPFCSLYGAEKFKKTRLSYLVHPDSERGFVT